MSEFKRPAHGGYRENSGRPPMMPVADRVDLGRKIYRLALDLQIEATARRHPEHADQLTELKTRTQVFRYCRRNRISAVKGEWVAAAAKEIWKEYLDSAPEVSKSYVFSATTAWAKLYRDHEKKEFRQNFRIAY